MSDLTSAAQNLRTELAMSDAVPQTAEQGEPVAFDEDAALAVAERTFNTEVDEQLATDIVQYAQRLHALYTAEQQPAPDVQREPVGIAGSFPGAEGFTTVVFDSKKVPEGTKLYTAPQQQTTPDVVGLVEALERISNMDSMSYHSLETAKIVARKALTTHHKQGGE